MAYVMNPRPIATSLLAAAFVIALIGVWPLSDGAGGSRYDDQMWTPCHEVSGRLGEELSPLVWFFEETLVPAELVHATSGVGQSCASGWGLVAGQRDYEWTVTYTFFEGEGDEKQEAVWWLFHQSWEDAYSLGGHLRARSGGGTVIYGDGYIVAVSPSASDEIRRAAEATPDTDVWQVVYAQSLAE